MALTGTELAEMVRRAVRARVPGITDDLIEHELYWAVGEFLTFTHAWKQVETVELQAGVSDYRISQNQAVPVYVAATLLAAWRNGQPLRLGCNLSTVTQADPEHPRGAPSAVELVHGTHLRVYPTPNESGGDPVQALLVMTVLPPFTDVQFPTAVAPYLDAVLSGVLSRLYAMDGKPWANPVAARFHVARFHNLMSSARASVRSGRSGAAPWRAMAMGGWP